MTLKFSPNHPNLKIILNALEERELTSPQIAALLKVTKRNANCAIRFARNCRLIRIVRWERRKGGLAVYGLADGRPDAPRPAPLTRQELRRRRHARLLTHFQVKGENHAVD